ncbi:MAG: hypothetical protein KKA19_00240, partial [Candidatus Margulisbacteria bacterium]|nr:hypothetical protein [Candidatus Margulisiibacteriota bacterium]
QAGHSAVLFRKKHPLLGLQLVNIFSKAPLFIYSAFDFFFLKRLFKKIGAKKSNLRLENKLRYFFHALGIKEAQDQKVKFPSTENIFSKYTG